jgi:hypothetical protein
MLACVVGPSFALVAFPVDFFDSLLFLKKMMWQKDRVCLLSGRSLKLKNMKTKKTALQSSN